MIRPAARSHPILLSIAAGLGVATVAIAAERWTTVRLDRAEWRCTAGHEDKIAVERAQGDVVFRSAFACDQWSRR